MTISKKVTMSFEIVRLLFNPALASSYGEARQGFNASALNLQITLPPNVGFTSCDRISCGL